MCFHTEWYKKCPKRLKKAQKCHHHTGSFPGGLGCLNSIQLFKTSTKQQRSSSSNQLQISNPSSASAVLKHLLESHNFARMYSSCFSIIGRVETTSQLCMKGVLLIYKHLPILNTQKETYEQPLLFALLDRGYTVNLPNRFWTVNVSRAWTRGSRVHYNEGFNCLLVFYFYLNRFVRFLYF